MPRPKVHASNAAKQAAYRATKRARLLAEVQQVQLGACTLYQGDARQILPLLPMACDALVTDPPYGVGQEYAGTWQDDGAFIKTVVVPIVRQALRMVKRGALFSGNRHVHLYPPVRTIGAWSMPATTSKGPAGFEGHSTILYYGTMPTNRHTLNTLIGAFYRDERRHPTAKPQGVMDWLTTRMSLPGETVLDPFMGSGTTGISCVKGGRRFVGIELDAGYFALACERLSEVLRQGDLFHAPAPPQARLFAS